MSILLCDSSKNDGLHLTQEYLIEQYKFANNDFIHANSPDQLISALRYMHRIEFLSASIFGFDFCSNLGKV